MIYDPNGNPKKNNGCSPCTSSDVYEEVIPQIKTLNFGYYPIPFLSAYEPRMDYVDSMPSAVVKYPDLSSGPTTSAEYYPYVDRIIWKIYQSALSGEIF